MKKLMKIILIRTCTACPEQYDAFTANRIQVGYLRLRHGYFRVDYPNVSGEMIYEAYPKGDGIFEEFERKYYIKQAKKAIRKAIKKYNPELIAE